MDNFENKTKYKGSKILNVLRNAFSGNTTKLDVDSTEYDNLATKLDIINSKIESQKQKLASLRERLSGVLDIPINESKIAKINDDIRKTETSIKSLTLQSNKTAQSMWKLEDKMKNVSNQSNNITSNGINSINKSVNSGISKIVKYGLALFSIRSIYTLLSRASSQYMQYDTENANKIKSAWVGLGATLQPIITYIGNAILKLVSYINLFVKALTGTDMIANANTKYLNQQAKATKNLTKANQGLSSMDEITNLSDSNADSGSANEDYNPFSAFENVELDDGWAKAFTSAGEKLRPVWEWLCEWIPKLGKWILENWEDVVSTFLLIKMVFDISTGNWIGLVMDFVLYLIVNLPRLWDSVKGIWDGLVQFGSWLIGGLCNMVSSAVDWFVDKWQIAKDFIVEFISNIPDMISKMWKKVVTTFKNIGLKIGEVVGKAFTSTVNAVLTVMENILNTPIKAINSLIKVINTLPGVEINKIKTFKLPRLDTGTNRVPRDMTAVIHKDEAVVPKKYNPAVNNQNNSSITDELLIELISKVEDLSQRPVDLKIDGKEFARTTYSYYKNEEKRLGSSTAIRRV
ncbi:MAG: hypothetical protein IJO32_00650 [Bacilli bacterium]|nr:hypothetical protein [Bacilli bacterium]